MIEIKQNSSRLSLSKLNSRFKSNLSSVTRIEDTAEYFSERKNTVKRKNNTSIQSIGSSLITPIPEEFHREAVLESRFLVPDRKLEHYFIKNKKSVVTSPKN